MDDIPSSSEPLPLLSHPVSPIGADKESDDKKDKDKSIVVGEVTQANSGNTSGTSGSTSGDSHSANTVPASTTSGDQTIPDAYGSASATSASASTSTSVSASAEGDTEVAAREAADSVQPTTAKEGTKVWYIIIIIMDGYIRETIPSPTTPYVSTHTPHQHIRIS